MSATTPGAAAPGSAAPALHARQAISYSQLVDGLRLAPNPVQVDFARIALQAMVDAHRAELKRMRARRGANRQHGQETQSVRWVVGVDSFSGELLALAERIADDSAVSILRGSTGRESGGEVQLLIDEGVVILSGPLASRQAAFEQGIVDRFCMRYLCQQLLVHNFPPDGETGVDGMASGLEISADAGFACLSGDGLELLFHGEGEAASRRHWCRDFMAELRQLVGALRRHYAMGGPVDWSAFSIEAALDQRDRNSGVDHRVSLNSGGDLVHLSLPLCAASPRLIERLLPWLANQAEGLGAQGISLIITNVDELIKPLPLQDR